MSGGIAQLVAIGAQDAHLVGNPEVSFFRSNYKRHTNFSHTVERQVIQGNPTANGMSTVRFERKGDLLSYVYLTAHNTSGAQELTSDQWQSAIQEVELLIGGQVVDTQTSLFAENLAVDTLAQNLSRSAAGSHHNGQGTQSYFFPLRFSFFENWQSALPLVGLQYHDVELRIRWGNNLNNFTYSCMASYIYLDNSERESLAQKPMNILMYQVQKAISSGTKVQELNFNHPVKFIAASNVNASNFFDVANKVKLQINGTDVTDYKYVVPNFTQTACYFHCPYSIGNTDDFFLYPFCLDTSRLQPTGTLNFSRLDTARILSETENIDCDFYAVNYNILRIQNGMGALLYAN